MAYKDPEVGREKARLYHHNHREHRLIQMRQYQHDHRETLAAQKKQHYQLNKKRISEERRQYRLDHPGRERNQKLRSNYGLHPGDYEALLAAQNNVCALCLEPPGPRSLAVDHNHDPRLRRRASVRGLLCNRCNPNLDHLVSTHQAHSPGCACLSCLYWREPPAPPILRALDAKARAERRRATSGAPSWSWRARGQSPLSPLRSRNFVVPSEPRGGE